MSQVHARFHLIEVTRTRYWADGKAHEAARVEFGAVQGEPFGPATPQGNFKALIVNPSAAKVFLDAPIGQEFDFIISPVKKAEGHESHK